MQEDVVDLAQQVPSRRRVGDREEHLGQLQPEPHCEPRDHERARPGGIASPARAHGSSRSGRPGATPAGPRRRTRGATRRSRTSGTRRSWRARRSGVRRHRPSRRDPSPTTRARLRHRRACRCCPTAVADGRRLREHVPSACSRSPASRCAFGQQQRARCPATGSTAAPAATAKLASSIICSGPSAQITLRNIARADSNEADAVQRHLVERRRVGDRRPALGVAGAGR